MATQAQINKHYAYIAKHHPDAAQDIDAVIALTDSIEHGARQGISPSKSCDMFYEAFSYGNAAFSEGNLSEMQGFHNGHDGSRNPVNVEWQNSDSQNSEFSIDMNSVRVDSVSRNQYGQDVYQTSFNGAGFTYEMGQDTDHESIGATLKDFGNGTTGYGDITLNGMPLA